MGSRRRGRLWVVLGHPAGSWGRSSASGEPPIPDDPAAPSWLAGVCQERPRAGAARL